MSSHRDFTSDFKRSYQAMNLEDNQFDYVLANFVLPSLANPGGSVDGKPSISFLHLDTNSLNFFYVPQR